MNHGSLLMTTRPWNTQRKEKLLSHRPTIVSWWNRLRSILARPVLPNDVYLQLWRARRILFLKKRWLLASHKVRKKLVWWINDLYSVILFRGACAKRTRAGLFIWTQWLKTNWCSLTKACLPMMVVAAAARIRSDSKNLVLVRTRFGQAFNLSVLIKCIND